MELNLANHLDAVVTAIIGALSIWWQNIANKRRINAEIKAIELTNTGTELSMYKELLNDLEVRFKKLHDENTNEIIALKEKLEKRETYWQNKFNELKRQFESYKTEHP